MKNGKILCWKRLGLGKPDYHAQERVLAGKTLHLRPRQKKVALPQVQWKKL